MELKSLNTGPGLTNTFKLGSMTANNGETTSAISEKAVEEKGNWLNSIQGILESGEKLASHLINRNTSVDDGSNVPPPPPRKSHTGLYIGLGIGALVLITAVVLIARKK